MVSLLCGFWNDFWGDWIDRMSCYTIGTDMVFLLCGFWCEIGGVLVWHWRWLDTLNDLLQNVHWNRFSPVWVLMWRWRLPDWLTVMLQTVQWNGFSPVWVLTWLLRWLGWLNDLLHNRQRNGLSPVWISILVCVLVWHWRWLDTLDVLLYHAYALSDKLFFYNMFLSCMDLAELEGNWNRFGWNWRQLKSMSMICTVVKVTLRLNVIHWDPSFMQVLP